MSKEMKELESQQSVCDIAWYLYKYTADESRHKRERPILNLSTEPVSREKKKKKKTISLSLIFFFSFFTREREKKRLEEVFFLPCLGLLIRNALLRQHILPLSLLFLFFLILKNTEKIVFVHDLKRGARGEILDASWISIKFRFRPVLFVCFEFVAVKQEI